MTQKQFIEGKIEQFDKEFKHKIVQEIGVDKYIQGYFNIPIKAFLSTALKEIVDEAYKAILPGEKSHSSIYDYDIGYNDAIQDTEDNIDVFLKTK